MAITKADQNVFEPVLATGSTTSRLLQDRFADVVNVKDFGAVGDGVADDTAAIQNAINFANPNKTIYFPGTGKYKITSTITVPSTVKVNFASNASVVPYTSFIVNGILYRDGFSPYDRIETGDPVGSNEHGRCFEFRTNSDARSNSGEYNYANITIAKDEVSYDSGGGKVAGLIVNHNFGGPNSSGGRHAIHGRALHGYGGPASQGPPNPATTDRNYVGVVGQVLTDAWEGGTAGSPKGAFFGINAFAGAGGNSTYVFNLTSGEFNTEIAPGNINRIHYHSGIQIASSIGTRGTFVDAAISVSNLGGPFGWKNGILMGAQNGRHALDTDSTAINVQSPTNTVIGITGETSLIINSAKFVVNHGSTSNGSCVIEIGSKTVLGGSPSLSWFHGSTALTQRIIASSTQLNIDAGFTTAKLFCPENNNLYDLGAAGVRWREIFAVNGTINTSDAREKQQTRDISDSEKLVSTKLKKLLKAYKWNNAVEEKGENARIHFGVIAQDVKEAFESEGLDASKYGVFCYDKWESTEGIIEENGSISASPIKAGNSYGIRYNELFAFILANI